MHRGPWTRKEKACADLISGAKLLLASAVTSPRLPRVTRETDPQPGRACSPSQDTLLCCDHVAFFLLQQKLRLRNTHTHAHAYTHIHMCAHAYTQAHTHTHMHAAAFHTCPLCHCETSTALSTAGTGDISLALMSGQDSQNHRRPHGYARVGVGGETSGPWQKEPRH